MKRFVEGDDRKQVALLPECVDDSIGQDNPVRVIDAFVDELDLTELGFNGTTPALTGRPSYHPGVMLKIYVYGYQRDFVYVARNDEYRCPAGERAIHRFTTVEHDMNLHVYWPSACPHCHLKERCSRSDYRRIRRWEHEQILEAMQRRLDRKPDAMTIRRSTVEHAFGTLKHWMGATHFLTRALGRVSTEMSLQVSAYNLKRVLNILGVARMRMAGS
jgi:hypothetical protein